MPAHKGFQVHIASEGRTLIEHEVVLKNLKDGIAVLTCYIASECGKVSMISFSSPSIDTDTVQMY